uniref:Integrase catalytic domain-containing protein n=1 Tax=Tanacetum cinerariifolium TaxID=118510 RepID=A0A699GJ18_TANCI|nr:hypothetical protein [Tanacetum cinerariifolium]
MHSLKLQLNATVKSHKTLSTTIDVLKKESKQKEDKYLDEIIDLQNKKKALDNVVYKMGQFTQTMHMLTKPQAFYDETHKIALGYQNPFYLSQARQKVPALYDGNTIVKTHVALSITDREETLELAEENKKYLEIEKKESSLNNDRLLEHIICQNVMNVVMQADHSNNVLPANNNSLEHDNSALELLQHKNDRSMELLISQDLVHTVVNSLAAINDYKSMEQILLDKYEENLKLKAELAKKNDTIDKAVYNELSKRCSRLENRCISIEIKLQQSKESFQTNKPSHNQDAPEFKIFFIINELQAQLKAKNVSIEKLKEHIANIKEKNVVESYNRDAHVNYLKHTQENVDTLHEIIEHARELRTLDTNLDSACKFVTRIQELLVYVIETCPSTTHVSNKFVVVTPMNKTRKGRFAESNDISKDKTAKQVQPQEKQATNNSMSPSIGVSNSTKASRSKARRNTKKDRISQTSRSNKKTNKIEAQPRIAKSNLNNTNYVSKTVCNENVKHSMLNANSDRVCATCNECMFDAIHDLCVNGYINDVNARVKSKSVKSRSAKSKKKDMIISTNVVPPRIFISATPVKQTPPSSNKSGKPTDITHVGSSSQSKTIGRTNCTLIAKIMGYGDYKLGSVTISRVHYVEGLEHNLFSVGQFCDSDLKVAFRKHTCYVQNLDGNDLLYGSRDTNLYTILPDDMLKSSPISLLSKASKTKSWLWHRRLSHLNFGKSKNSSHKPKAGDTNKKKLYPLHMDFCRPMCVESINGKKYILVIVDDYSRFTWFKFLRSKYEALEVIIKCLKEIQVRLNATVCNVRTDNGTEFMNRTLHEYYENAEAVNTAYYTQNRSLICFYYNKTLYELMHNKKRDLSYLHVFGSLCYPTNDNEDLGKLKAKSDIGIFLGYAPIKKAFRIYNKRTRLIMETIHVTFDELTSMASEQFSLGVVSPVPVAAAPRPVDPTGSPV